jgi:hypothetical protein
MRHPNMTAGVLRSASGSARRRCECGVPPTAAALRSMHRNRRRSLKAGLATSPTPALSHAWAERGRHGRTGGPTAVHAAAPLSRQGGRAGGAHHRRAKRHGTPSIGTTSTCQCAGLSGDVRCTCTLEAEGYARSRHDRDMRTTATSRR